MSTKLYCHFLLLSILQSSHGFVAHPQRNNACALIQRIDDAPTTTATTLDLTSGDGETGGIELVSLAALGEDHDNVGEAIGNSVAAWLDMEWLPQEVHVKMGVSVKNTYVAERSKGVDDIASIMTQVTDDLYENWAEYNADAFVNAWDIGNYVADYLIAKSGSETCGCSTEIVE